MLSLDSALTGEAGEVIISGRRISYKAKWRVHSFNEPLVWDAMAQDMQTGMKVEVSRQSTDTYANKLAIQKLCEKLQSEGLLC